MPEEQPFEVTIIGEQQQSQPAAETIHYLEVEWYEVIRSRIKRKTNRGLELLIQKDRQAVLEDGALLFADKQITVLLKIKPCECIVVEPKSIHEMGRVCFEIGNKHVPIFLNQNQEVSVAYDAGLYQLLLGGNFGLRLESRVLHPGQMVKAYGNTCE